jgi:hypothetical protein
MLIIEKKSNISLHEYILWGAEFFRQRPNFLVDLAEKFCQELVTLVRAEAGATESHKIWWRLKQEASRYMRLQLYDPYAQRIEI